MVWKRKEKVEKVYATFCISNRSGGKNEFVCRSMESKTLKLTDIGVLTTQRKELSQLNSSLYSFNGIYSKNKNNYIDISVLFEVE